MISVRSLTKNFGARQAVKGVTFDVAKGEVLGFLGPNGAGKTTTMRMITGFLAPTAGTAVINGNDIQTDPVAARRSLGYLPESAPSYGDMTVQAFLRFIAEMRGFTGTTRDAAADRAIERCFLTGVRHQTIETLSKGYRQRTGFAQAILHDPPVLIMDEPTDGLDPNQKHVVRNMIKEMAREKAIVLSTHVLEEVDALCTRVIIISNGTLVANNTPDTLMKQGSLEQVFRKLTTTADVGEVSR